MSQNRLIKLALAAVGALLLVVVALVLIASRERDVDDQLFWLGWASVPAAIGALILWAKWIIRRQLRIEDAEIQRFQERPVVDDAAFLQQLGIAASSNAATIAIGARRALARLGCVPPESITASDRFFPDLDKLPFYDSIDLYGIVLELEQELHVSIVDDQCHEILEKIPHSTIGETVLAVVHVLAEQQVERSQS